MGSTKGYVELYCTPSEAHSLGGVIQVNLMMLEDWLWNEAPRVQVPDVLMG